MILVLNCGSQSIKWKVFDKDLKVIKFGSRVVFDQETFQKFLEEELNKLKGMEIVAVGHRVVHGKDIFVEPTEMTEENIKKVELFSNLAPLHNPFNVLGIKICQRIFEGIPQVAVFDTEFFKDLPETAYTYALPENIVNEFGFRKYGFHGISHEYVAMKAAEIMGKSFDKLRIITCHLGGGSSITAIKNGKAIDTSMGFTPMQGAVMMTRAGDMDSGIILELVREFTLDKAKKILNEESGIKGICGESDMLEVLRIIDNKKTENPERSRRVELALDVFVYSIQKYIGSYFAILGGCDVLVFTGAIGAGSEKIRNMVCENLEILKKTRVLVIETDEELAIANKIKQFIK